MGSVLAKKFQNHTVQLINDNPIDGIHELISRNVWVDCVITSFNEKYFNSDTIEKELFNTAQHLKAVLSNDGTVYIKVAVSDISLVSCTFEKAGFKLKNILVVPMGTSVTCHSQKYVDENLEYFLFFTNICSPTLYMKPVQYNDKYDCHYSAVWSWFKGGTLIDIYRMIMKISTDHSQAVLDPFMNIGDVGKAAVLQDRNFIGIEPDRIIYDDTKRMLDELGE